MKVLITGGAGFIGYHLGEALSARGDDVHLLDNFSRGVMDRELASLTAKPRVSLHQLDFLDRAQVERLDDDYDAIFHLAAIVGVAHVAQRPYEVLVSNAMLLEQAIRLARRQRRSSRLLFASSSEVYAGALRYLSCPVPTPEDVPLAVTDVGEARTSYMLSKIYGEAMCRASGVPFTVFRPHNVYGPRMGMSHAIPELLARARLLKPGEALEVFSIEHRRAFCYIDDAVELLVRMLDSTECIGRTLNLGNQDEEVSMAELAHVVLDVVGVEARIAPVENTQGSPARRAPDMTQTFSLTGYRAGVNLASGVARTYRWYREHVFDGGEVSAR